MKSIELMPGRKRNICKKS